MLTRFFLMLFASLSSLGSCRLPPSSSAMPPPVAPPPVTEVPCGDAQRIAYLSNPAVCTSPDYGGQPLFPRAQSPELQRYCVIPFERVDPDEPDTEDLRLNLEKTSSIDCRVVAAMGPAEPWSKTHSILRDHLFQEVERPKEPVDAKGRARISVVDTAVRVEQKVLDQAGHGVALGRMLDSLLCPDPQDCPVALDYKLALPRVRNKENRLGENRDDGGYFGSFADTAQGIYHAVESWKEENARVRDPERLVINLSLGWLGRPDLARSHANDWRSDPTTGWTPAPGPGGDFRHAIAIRAVTAALAYASCHGALVFASAGNQTGGAFFQDGLLYPAVWQQAPGPSEQDCSGPFEVSRVGGSRPLLYAVAAYDDHGQPIANARAESRTTLEAPGQWGVGRNEDDTATRTLSGSSVSAALMSGAAALYWAIAPEAKPEDVIQALIEAWPLLRTTDSPSRIVPDYSLGSESVRRYSLCVAANAALQAVQGTPVHCEARTDDRRQLWEPGPEAVVIDAQGPLKNARPIAGCTGALGRGRQYWSNPGSAVSPYPCPESQLYMPGALTWSGPQPGEDPCPHCSYSANNHTLRMAISREYEDSLRNPVLYLVTATEEHAIELSKLPDWNPLSGGDEVVIEDLQVDPAVDPGMLRGAWIVFALDTNKADKGAEMSITSPVWIDDN